MAGHNKGLAHEKELKFAQEDARKVGSAFLETGAVSEGHLSIGTGESLKKIKERLVSTVASVSARDSVVIFLSAHGDQRGLHIDGEIWSWRDLKKEVGSIRAATVFVFVDACMSGSILSPKGFVTVARRKVKATKVGPKGKVIIASSGASQLSHESTLLRGSPFASSLSSGLRGAADRNNDDRITIGELYSYIYRHAAADTVTAPGGPQRAVRDVRVKGAGDLVLVRVKGDRPRLLLGDAALGRCFVLDDDEREIVAELSASPSASVALPKGAYQIRCLSKTGVHGGSVEMDEGDVHLSGLVLKPMERRRASLAKGPSRRLLYTLSAYGGGCVSGEKWGGIAGVSVGFGPAGGGLELSTRGVWIGDEAGLVSTLDLYAFMPWGSVFGSGLDLGISGGLELKNESSSGYDPNGVTGPFARFKWNFKKQAFVVLGISALTVFYNEADEKIGFTMLATAGVALRFKGKER